MIRLISFFLALGLGASHASAQNPSETPELAVTILMEAFQESDFERAATLMHPDGLVRFREAVIVLLDQNADELFRMLGLEDNEAASDLDPKTFFSTFVNVLHDTDPSFREAFGNMNFETIGYVNEGDSIAHVVTRSRITLRGVTFTRMEILSAQRYGEGWLALLVGNLAALAERIEGQLPQDLKE